jgi:hypothetical protein
MPVICSRDRMWELLCHVPWLLEAPSEASHLAFPPVAAGIFIALVRVQHLRRALQAHTGGGGSSGADGHHMVWDLLRVALPAYSAGRCLPRAAALLHCHLFAVHQLPAAVVSSGRVLCVWPGPRTCIRQCPIRPCTTCSNLRPFGQPRS